MAQLTAVICQAIVHHYGREEFLRRLAHPLLVSVVRRPDGNRLAFVWHYDERYWSALAR
jgi:hypothetical protein